MQTGAKIERRVTENIYIIQYLIQKTFKRKKQLFISSIDFAKAFDSIDRFQLLNILQGYKIHAKIINIIADTYSYDITRYWFSQNSRY